MVPVVVTNVNGICIQSAVGIGSVKMHADVGVICVITSGIDGGTYIWILVEIVVTEWAGYKIRVAHDICNIKVGSPKCCCLLCRRIIHAIIAVRIVME